MPSLTDTELNQSYPNGILPISSPGANNRENGILKRETVTSIVNGLRNTGVIPELPNNRTYGTFTAKQEKLLTDIRAEYEFYESRYKVSLNNLFESIQLGNINNTTENQNKIDSNLTIVQTLNRKLNDLTQIINGITDYLLSSTNVLEGQIREFDNKIRENHLKLQKQNNIITSSEATTELNKQMVKYTEQKAKYSNNLLGLYSFLNIVAVGLLVYVYKSSNE